MYCIIKRRIYVATNCKKYVCYVLVIQVYSCIQYTKSIKPKPLHFYETEELYFTEDTNVVETMLSMLTLKPPEAEIVLSAG